MKDFWKKFYFSFVTVVAMVSFVCSAEALSVAYPANGLYSLQPQCAPDKELTVENAGTNNGANVFLWSINSNWHTQPSHQKWYVERIGNSEWYTIKAENSGKCLNVDGGAAKDFTNITLWQRTDENQTFRFFDAGNGNYIIQGHTHGGFFVLDVYYAGNADGTNVTNCGYNGSPAQIWKLVRRNPSSQGSQQPQQNNTSSYDNKVKNFINNPQFSAGSSKTWDCFAYATQFVKNVHGYSGVRNGQYFNSPNQIRSGDVVHVKPRPGVSENPHWIIVLYRNGNRLTTIEGNWDKPKVNGLGRTRYSETDYYIQGNHFCRGNSVPFRSFDCGYHY